MGRKFERRWQLSSLYQLRKEVKNLLLLEGLWNDGEVIIKRRSDLWNTVATAIATSEAGQCLVIGVAKGSPSGQQKSGSKQLLLEVTIPVTLIERPTLAPEEEENEEDGRWEATTMRLLGDPLERSPEHYEMIFDGFEEISDEEYIIRQTTFKTKLLLKK